MHTYMHIHTHPNYYRQYTHISIYIYVHIYPYISINQKPFSLTLFLNYYYLISLDFLSILIHSGRASSIPPQAPSSLYLVKIICLYLFLNWLMFGHCFKSMLSLFHSLTPLFVIQNLFLAVLYL